MSIVLSFQTPPGKPILRGNRHYWSVILDLDLKGPWTVHEIDMQSRAKARGTITDFVGRLIKAGIAEPTGETRIHRNLPTPTYRLLQRPAAVPSLTADGVPARVGRGQTQMWNVMRGPLGREGFTARDLHVFGTTDDVAVSLETAKTYLRCLNAAGYLVELGGSGSRRATAWRLKPAMNTGPKAPMILRAKIVFDQNRSAALGPVEAEEASS